MVTYRSNNSWFKQVNMKGSCDAPLISLPHECYNPEIKLGESNYKDCYEVVLFSTTDNKTNNHSTLNLGRECLFYCPQTCICEGLSFTCKTPNVPKIARSVDISSINLRDNVFPVSTYRFLVYLNLSNCGLSTFEFNMIPSKLQVLDLSNNYIISFDASFIGNQTRQQILVFLLNNNPLERVDRIRNLFYVRYLQMRNASLNETFLWTTHFVYGNYFDFSYNNLRSNIMSFNYLKIPMRMIMNLSHNDISEIDDHLFEVLDISFNRFNFFPVTGTTTRLFVQHNQLIKFVGPGAGYYLFADLRFIDIGYNVIESITREELKPFRKLRYISMKGNRISEIKNKTFSDLSALLYLDLSVNRIETVEKTAFDALTNLQFLYLQGNLLTEIKAKLFSNLVSLTVLDLSFNNIQFFEKNGLMGLRKLKRLYLQSNQFKVYEAIFSGANELTYLEVSDYTLCCAKPVTVTKDQCVAPKNEISSCDQLVDVAILGVFIWYMAPLAVFGNLAVLIYRTQSWQKTKSKTQAIFTMNLSFADLLMGIYLYIIAFTDLSYKGKYGIKDDTWRNSLLCTLSGIIATLSSESSAFHVLLITLDRVVALRCGLSGFRISKKMAKLLCLIIWVLCIIISVLPAMEKTYFATFYSRSGICVSLPLSVKRSEPWEYSMVIFIGVNFFLFFGVFVGQVAIFIEVIRVGGKVQTKQSKEREISLAKTLFAVVITDMLCWIPIGIIGMVTFSGHDVSSTVYAWIVVVVLPLNSSLNPFLYTIVVYIREKRNKRKKIKKGSQHEMLLKMKGKEKNTETKSTSTCQELISMSNNDRH